MKQDVFPVGQGARKRRSQWLAFGIFKLLSYSIVLILFDKIYLIGDLINFFSLLWNDPLHLG